MREKQIEAIRQKCIEANPEIETQRCGNCGYEMDGGYCRELDSEGEGQPHCPGPSELRPIRLADVLLAIKNKSILVDITGNFWEWRSMNEAPRSFAATWNLRKDDLTEQSDECITFLAELLK